MALDYVDFAAAKCDREVHPWEFWPMPQGPIHFGEGAVTPDPFIVANCGGYALEQLDLLLLGLRERGAAFTSCAAYVEGRKLA